MKYSDFVHLHVHSDYSLLDGAGPVSSYVSRAFELKMPALALTDHGSMFGAISFYKQALRNGIKPIVGCELNVAKGSMHERKPGQRGGPDGSNHLIVLARDAEGYANLVKLVSLDYTEGFYYKPRVDLDLLSGHSKGLIALTACLKGSVGESLAGGRADEARARAGALADIFGKGGFYLEVQRHGLAEEEEVVKGVIRLAAETGLGIVATNDCHYIEREDARAQDVLLCLQTGRELDDPTRMRFENDQFYFKTAEEMRETFRELPEALATTVEVAEKCNLDLDLGRIRLPNFPIPEGYADADGYLEHLARQGLAVRYPGGGREPVDRLEYEIRTIREMNYSSYFLIINDLVQAARAMGIPVGPGRGSAAGSIVSYCLRITDIDPLKFGLLFERFLNPERVSMPDIDIDFCDKRRQEVIDYVTRKYGKESVSQIITFGTMAARAAIRDVGRVLRVPIQDVDRIAKMVPADPGMTLDLALERVTELRQTASDERYKDLMDLAKRLEGLARHASTHAAGVLITPGKLIDYVPLYRGTKGETVTQYDMTSVEDIGLLKMDFLGLTTLSVLHDTLRFVRERYGVDLKPEEMPLDDPEVYRMLAAGHTVGVFQLESSGMRDLLRRIAVSRFEDIIAINALHRPGPLASEMVDLFINRKRGTEPIDYEHPMLEPILKDTYGVILYQEQVIEIASRLAGFTKGQADILRRAIGKKEPEVMEQQQRSFVKGAAANRIGTEVAKRIFSKIAYFAGYGFNKSHSAAYALLSYQTAYLKAKYPVEFMAAGLTSEMENTDRIVILMEETRRMGLTVLPPSVNASDADFKVEEGGIRFGLAAIKNVGRSAIDSVVAARARRGPFKTIFDLCEAVDLRTVNKRVLESLAYAGALDCLDGHRAQIHGAVETAMGVGQKSQKDRTTGQTSLLVMLEDRGESRGIERRLPQVEEWSLMEKLAREREVLGFYCSGHPLHRYERELRAFTTNTIAELKGARDPRRVVIGGVVAGGKTVLGKDGRKIRFVPLEDLTGQIEAIFFSDRMGELEQRLKPGLMILVWGTASSRNEEQPKVRVNDFMDLESSIETLTERIEIGIDSARFGEASLDLLAGVLDSNPGEVPISVVVISETEGDVVVQIPKTRVKPTRELIAAVDGIEGVANV
ncbi:MAG: DNA polymerase III subunit alpha, partial [bacterium]